MKDWVKKILKKGNETKEERNKEVDGEMRSARKERKKRIKKKGRWKQGSIQKEEDEIKKTIGDQDDGERKMGQRDTEGKDRESSVGDSKKEKMQEKESK